MTSNELGTVLSESHPHFHGNGGILDRRLLKYGARIIAVVQALPRTLVGAHIGRQMLRSGTSAGANYREARGAESRADFVHKVQIVVKELRETDFWLRMAVEAKLVSEARLRPLIQETDELTAMSVSSVKTAKSKARHANRS